jgi:predicted Zn-dependent protease
VRVGGISVALALWLVACATNPATGRREVSLMSEGQEIAIGKEQDALVQKEMGLYRDPELQQYVSGIGLALAQISERPNLPWHFAVVDQPAINAFALPGGYIYLTRGILPFLDNEAELAGVLGHEIGHVTARHAAQQYTRAVGGQVGLVALGIFVPSARPVGDLAAQGLGLLFLKYGREDELQADGLGARYATRANWDPAGVPGMLSTLGRLEDADGERKGVPNFLATHPEPLARVKDIEPQIAQLRGGRTDLKRDRDTLLRRVDGIIYGDNPEQGIVRGNAFLHPVLRFAVDFPPGWAIQNTAAQVVAKAPNAEIYMLLQAAEQPRGRDIEEIAVSSMQAAGFTAVSGEKTTIGGIASFVGVYQGQIEELGAVSVRAAHIPHGDSVYMLAGLAAPDVFRQADASFVASLRSFRVLSASEAENVRPNRIDLYVVRQGDTWAGIAERTGNLIKPAALAIMNNAEPSAPPQVGSRVKIVVGG